MAIDVAFLAIVLLAVFKGFSRGFLVAVFSFLAYVIGLAAALKLSVVVAHHLENQAGASEKWMPVLAFSLVFIAVVILVNICARLLRKIARLAMLGWLDRLGGIFLYLAIYIIIFSVVLFFLEKTSFLRPETVAASKVHGFVQPWAPAVIDNVGKIIPAFRDMFLQLSDFFAGLRDKMAV